MRHAFWLAACLVTCLSAHFAFGYGGLTITILNNSSDTVLVTIYDQSPKPPKQILAGRPIYGNASLTVSIATDIRGRGHLSWTAIGADRDMHRCGSNELTGLHDGDTVNVYADSDCS